jgi:hypothetical protein
VRFAMGGSRGRLVLGSTLVPLGVARALQLRGPGATRPRNHATISERCKSLAHNEIPHRTIFGTMCATWFGVGRTMGRRAV